MAPFPPYVCVYMDIDVSITKLGHMHISLMYLLRLVVKAEQVPIFEEDYTSDIALPNRYTGLKTRTSVFFFNRLSSYQRY